MSALGVSRAWPLLPRARAITRVYTRAKSMKCKDSFSGSPRGALIVFEGIDRCGKTTQSDLLVKSLNCLGARTEHWRFPDRSTTIGRAINDYLKNGVDHDDTVIHLLFTANRFEKSDPLPCRRAKPCLRPDGPPLDVARKEMLRLLAGGTTLVLDRYSYSGVAYTAAKGLPHLDASYCRSVEVGLPAADLVVYMDMSPEQAAARGGFGGERYEKLEFQRKVSQQYQALKDERWLILDAALQPEAIHREVVAAVLPVVERAARGAPLCRLWDYAPLQLATGEGPDRVQSGPRAGREGDGASRTASVGAL